MWCAQVARRYSENLNISAEKNTCRMAPLHGSAGSQVMHCARAWPGGAMRVPGTRANTFAQMTNMRSCFFSPLRYLPAKRCRGAAGSAAAAGNMSRREAAALCMRLCEGRPRPARIARWSRPAYLRRRGPRWPWRGTRSGEHGVEKLCRPA